MIIRFKRFTIFCLAIFCLSLGTLNVFADAAVDGDTPPTPVEADEGSDSSSLQLFDSDAERTKKGWSQFYVSVGAMHLQGAGELAVRLPNDKEVTILDFDRAGLDDTDSSYWFSMHWRSANSHWGAWFSTWKYDVIGSRTWEDSLEIGDQVIPVGASVTSKFDAKWYVLEGTYSFYRTKNIDTGIGFGFHVVDLDTTVRTEIQVGDEEFESVAVGIKTTAPLPNILGYFHWKMADRLSVTARAGYFSLDYKEFSGGMTNAHVMGTYKLSERWGLGLGYQFVDFDLEVEKKNLTQIYDIDFSGPVLFFRFRF